VHASATAPVQTLEQADQLGEQVARQLIAAGAQVHAG